jgi:SAM-dependent methyltransferase
MAFELSQVVPWGRSYDEYVSMFSLSEEDHRKRILGCGDGPAGFNAEITLRGGHVISVDPIYQFSANEIKKRIQNTYETVLEQTKKNKDEFTWKAIKDVDALGEIRMKAMTHFLEDYPQGRAQGRYIAGSLPNLPFVDKSFDLALCSHFLFLYSGHFDMEFHFQSIVELCRVAHEVRIFPLLELGARKARDLDKAMEELVGCGYECTIQKVGYEFQKGGDEMLVVRTRDMFR